MDEGFLVTIPGFPLFLAHEKGYIKERIERRD